MSALHELLKQIVDYAGLFPPAALDLNTVVNNYCRYRSGPAEWMLARVVVPAGRLDAFHQVAQPFWDDNPWPVSALVASWDAEDDGFHKSMELIEQFNDGQSGAVVDAIEIRCPEVDHIAKIAESMPSSIRAFLEVPHTIDPKDHIEAIKATGSLFAKIRTGGVTPDLIPPVEQVARFIQRCAQADVGFKATAGLHHPLRNEFNLTYQPDSERATMHGFLNVFVASVLAFEGAGLDTIQQVLSGVSIEPFQFSEDGIRFGEHVAGLQRIAQLREEKIISFGSCSFEEPVGDLRQLGFESEIQSVQ